MKGNRGLLLLIIALILGGLLVFYFSHYSKEPERQPGFQAVEPLEPKDLKERDVIARSPTMEAPQEKLEEVLGEKEIGGKTISFEDECRKLEENLIEFFEYLDGKDYIRKLEIEGDTFANFKRILQVLSLNPPVPAGENFEHDMMIKNIYHFYRVLGLKDLNLIRLILNNEADSMEINLASFYEWLMLGDKCNYKEAQPPALNILYRYAGFLTNSIGGKAYLFRRETKLRLLINYYCVLILHEADKKKMNNFGIDIIPHLEPLADEIENYEFLYFRKEYAGKLIDIKNYYINKRKNG
ncbi:MAG TPA: hypothetical protein VMW42_08255 [Desulfatiglandales bacterium]|nr:hypothetical protein [Desulfatiglandales bacterium]